uniref:Uncharacterized protein n=1 Tax=Rhizophora mucronata TaxID=61149 RepID=A0A2P2MZ04_RHIMU
MAYYSLMHLGLDKTFWVYFANCILMCLDWKCLSIDLYHKNDIAIFPAQK